jgi:gliding motility-associated-like protein
VKILILQILICVCSINAFASHIVGGEVYYKYLGQGNTDGTSMYQIYLRLFRDCTVPCGGTTTTACLPAAASVSIFSAASPYTRISTLNLPLDSSKSITLTTYPSCISDKPTVCYEVKTYSTTISLPDNDIGYVIAYQDCCRAKAINQFGVANTSNNVPGATYIGNIPGANALPSGHNNSAIFKLKDTALVCMNSSFSIDFSATDADGDSLSYAFTSAYDGGDFWSSGCTYTEYMQQGSCNLPIQPAGPPPYNDITYNTNKGFAGTSPLGNDVTINPVTGLISGKVKGSPGHYIVNVIVYEWRNHKVITSHRKDFIIQVEDCNIPQAELAPFYLTCNGFDMNFENNSTSSLINSYYWDFGDTKNNEDTSTSPTPSYTYTDSGTYVVTLITNKGGQCSDTATTLAEVYPGFIPDFSVVGGCINAPYQFTDLTTSKYGKVNSWRWDFGDLSTVSDTSILPNPIYAYADTQHAQVRLITGNSKGCIDTVYKVIQVNNTILLQLPFRDTLICAGDQLQLQVSNTTTGSTTFNWTPLLNINNPNLPNPVVSPTSTTIYHVAVNYDNGCKSSDSVKVNVISSVSMDAGKDTTICLTDSIQLFPGTNALYFVWSPAASMSDPTVKDPFVKPLVNTQYKVVASVGHCSASDSVNIQVAPYPQVVAGDDTAICYGNTVQLTAFTAAPNFAWSPTNSLLQANTLTPVAKPYTTTAYVITVRDTGGCPKPVSDTTLVTVYPRIYANAGNDTAIVVNQPLQLNATGGTSYIWSPTTGLSNPFIANPVVTLSAAYDSVIYHVTVSNPGGCTSSDDIKVIVFKTLPDIFVPTAFTPNSDGLNDRLKAIPVGIKEFQYLKVFNRWGELVFATSNASLSWDGMIKGQPQGTAVFTWMARGIDFSGKVVERKGTLTLLR